jgi:tight adherence protein B
MSNWTVYLLFFVSAALFTIGGYEYFAKEKQIKQRVNRRLSVMESVQDPQQALTQLLRERGIFGNMDWHGLERVSEWLAQTGLRIEKTQAFIAIAVFSAVVMTSMVHFIGTSPVALAAGVAFIIFAVFFTLRIIRARRIMQFSQQLPDVLDIMVRSLRAGHPIPASLSLVARETSDPAGSEFGVAFDEVTYGLDIPSAMRNVWQRVGDPDLLYLVTAISVQTETGGNLSEILARLSRMMRKRFAMRLKIRSLAAESRMSAYLLTGLPIFLFLLVNWATPTYFGEVWNDPTFRKAMYVAAVLLIVGNAVMRRMVNFRI